jgi:hypothetical protein
VDRRYYKLQAENDRQVLAAMRVIEQLRVLAQFRVT